MPYDRLFTVEEVNALVPRLEVLVEKLQRHGLAVQRAVRSWLEEHGSEDWTEAIARLVRERPDVRHAVDQMDAALGEIESLGGEFKGLDLGLVDFPAEIDGEIVFLCWQYGEKEVGFYHAVDAGFAGRKPLGSVTARTLH
ncbi:MAG: hypothetical protein KatS3mg076_0133 [Candidatus Binatia bacterium]|nr:MAG: hypothetical protein KatS3mg076_0133 [Candidatus Binatia bacterium]